MKPQHLLYNALRLWNYCAAYRYAPDLVGATAYGNYLRMWHQLARAAEDETDRTKVRIPRYADGKIEHMSYVRGVVNGAPVVVVRDELLSTHTIASHLRFQP